MIVGFAVRLFTPTGFIIGLFATRSRPNITCPVNYVNVTRKNGMFRKTYRLFVRRVGKWMTMSVHIAISPCQILTGLVSPINKAVIRHEPQLRAAFGCILLVNCSLTADRLETAMSTSPCSAPRSHSCGTVCPTVSNEFITCRTRKKVYPFVLSALHAATVTTQSLRNNKDNMSFFAHLRKKCLYIL